VITASRSSDLTRNCAFRRRAFNVFFTASFLSANRMVKITFQVFLVSFVTRVCAESYAYIRAVDLRLETSRGGVRASSWLQDDLVTCRCGLLVCPCIGLKS